MPLLPGRANIGKNIATEDEAGKPRRQAIAIALSVARRTKEKMTSDTIMKSDNVPAKNKKRAVAGPKKSWAAAYKKRTKGS